MGVPSATAGLVTYPVRNRWVAARVAQGPRKYWHPY